MQHAEVRLRPDGWFVNSQHLTTEGALLAGPPCRRLPLDATDDDLAAAVRDALAGSTSGRHGLDRHPEFVGELYRTAGVRTWTSFVRGATGCDLEADGDGVVRVGRPSLEEGDVREATGQTVGAVVRALLSVP